MFYRFARFLVMILCKLVFRIHISGMEDGVPDGGCIFAANHFSNLDPIITSISYKGQLRFLAKDELFRIPVLKNIMKLIGAISVKRGAGDVSAIKESLAVLREGQILAMFPEGTRVGANEVNEAKTGIAYLAVKTGVPVVPICITGKYKLFGRIDVVYGRPISFGNAKKITGEELRQISDKIMDEIYSLRR